MKATEERKEDAHATIRAILAAAPALAGAAASSLTGWAPGQTALLAAALIAIGATSARSRRPEHLMRFATFMMAVALPLAGVGAVVAACVLAGADPSPLTLPAIAGAATATAVFSWRARELLDAMHTKRVAVIGSPRLAAALAEELAASGRAIAIAGWIEGSPEGLRKAGVADSPETATPAPLGSLQTLRETVIAHRIDLLVHGAAGSWAGEENPPIPRLELFESVAHCLDLPVRLVEANHFYEDELGHVPLGAINSAWFQHIMHPRFRPGSSVSKRAMDLVLGAVMAIALAPLVAVAALAVKLHDGGPIIYRQRRIGVAGQEIEVLKLRSMGVEAECDGARWSSADDPRVTPIGRILRRTHVDELPQLWNVLRGDMTLVGPRPERPELAPELMLQHSHYDRRHLVKPGLTGWAQVRCGYAGSGTGTAWKLCHDLFYLKHRSAMLDLMILVETVRTAVRDAQFDLRAPDERFLLDPAPEPQRISA